MHQYGYWRRQRGIANSKSLELALLAYKSQSPSNQPKQKMYIDQGSTLFKDVVRTVPVLAPKLQAMVTRQVREASFADIAGVPDTDEEDAAEGVVVFEGDEETQAKALMAAVAKRRKLYKQNTGTLVPWFPHDNDPELLKELVWEGGNPRWVLSGTPAGGADNHGCFETGGSVVALCYNEHQRTHLQ